MSVAIIVYRAGGADELGIDPSWPAVNCIFLGQTEGGMVQILISKKDTQHVFNAASAMTTDLPDGAALLQCMRTSH